ncbi:MAG: portal protein [Shewanella sp.]|nr:portal protein [Shewanella sp.]
MPTLNVHDIIHTFNTLESDRGTWESHWSEIADYLLPRQAGISETSQVSGQKRTTRIYDSTPQIALERFASVFDSLLTPRQQRWHGLKFSDDYLNQQHNVKLWLEETTNLLFKHRYRPTANFTSQNYERWMSVGGFGTGVLYTDYYKDIGLRYRVIHLKHLFFIENHQGIVDCVYRRFIYTLRQAEQKWGKRLPEQLLTLTDNPKNMHRTFPFLHVVGPREDVDAKGLSHTSQPFYSYYICLTSKTLISEGGYTSFPYSVSRYVTAPDEIYGRSPAMAALADVKMVNEMSKTDIRAVHKLVDPPLLVADDGVIGSGLNKVKLIPGGLNVGGLDMQGRPLIQPMVTNARVDINEEKMERRRNQIEDAFMLTLFQILTENPRMTASEALLRAQEKGVLLSPIIGRQQSEALGPQIERELDLLIQYQKIPPYPMEVQEAAQVGIEIEIDYDAPVNRLQRSEELVGVSRTIELLAPFANMKPEILDIFDLDALSRLSAEVSGVPASVIKSQERLAAEQEERENEESIAKAAAVAEPISVALKNTAQAQALGE